jgi:hypothetical protein
MSGKLEAAELKARTDERQSWTEVHKAKAKRELAVAKFFLSLGKLVDRTTDLIIEELSK